MQNNKKTKLLLLSKECIKQLSKDAIDNGSNFKNYVEDILEKMAEKSIEENKKKQSNFPEK